ncbi:MAG: flagellar basal body rod protein [Oscillospiraceae bacterium]|jgi:flagellar basal-body rod protein FlgG|nr:flagellar basal body rod protein [Oscillospiraceae bacterium]
MVRGFYSAGTGLLTNSRKLDIAGDNMANTRTAGYKKNEAVSASFKDNLTVKIDKLSQEQKVQIGSMSGGQRIDSIFTDFEQGSLENTGSPFNLAIGGEGFFSIQEADNVVRYTRNGELGLDQNGFITNLKGGRLMGQNGPINTAGKPFEVSSDGGVYVDGNLVDKLAIYNPADTSTMVKYGEGMFVDTGTGAQKPFAGTIQQGYIEMSNVNMVDQMMGMMTSQRSFQSCSQILKMIDATLEKAVQVGRMG